MCPFLDDEEDDFETVIDSDSSIKSNFFNDEKKFFIIGGVAAVISFLVIGYFLCFNQKNIVLEDLPIIKADSSPLKVKPTNNETIPHQDKTVYDNISGDHRVIKEKIADTSSEEVLNIPDGDVENTLTEEEKKNIIKAFDDLVAEKEYKINYIKKQDDNKKIKSNDMLIVESNEKPPLNIIKEEKKASSSKKQRLKDLINTELSSRDNIMVQIASVHSKSAADAEYKRIKNKNRFLNKVGKRISKVDLGQGKGTRYRVQVGPFKNKSEAKKIIALLKSNGFSSYISQ